MAPKTVTLDFTDVKDGSLHRRTRFPEGDYKGRILSVVDQLSSKDDTPMWVYTLEVRQGKKTGTYPYYCKIDEKNLWKLRSLFAAVGITIPKKRFQVDPNRIVGKLVGVTLVDDEYKDRIQSNVEGVVPISDISDADDPEIDDQDEDEDEDDEPVRPAKKTAKKRPAPVEPEDDEEDEEEEPPAKPVRKRKVVEPEPEEDEDEEDEEPTPPPVKKPKRKPVPVVEPDDEDDEDEDEPAPAPKKAPKKTSKKARQIAAVSDDELDELDIEDL